MSAKTRKIIGMILLILPSLMLVMSAAMKISGNEEAVKGLTKAGYGPYIKIVGFAELLFVVLLLIPKTHRLGLLLITGYIGGAASLEISGGNPPFALVILTIIWIGAFIKDPSTFLPKAE